MNGSGLRFTLCHAEFRGRRVLEVGCAGDLTLRRLATRLGAAEYVGVDPRPGPGVDVVALVEDVRGEGSFDVVLCGEVLEHAGDWRAMVEAIARLAKPGASLILTTRSRGYPYHPVPEDHWRFEIEDMPQVLHGWNIVRSQVDPEAPGVFVSAIRLPGEARPEAAIYSVAQRRRLFLSIPPPPSMRCKVAARIDYVLCRFRRRLWD